MNTQLPHTVLETMRLLRTRSTRYSDLIHLNEMVFLLHHEGYDAALYGKSYHLTHPQKENIDLDFSLLWFDQKWFNAKKQTTWTDQCQKIIDEDYPGYRGREMKDLGMIAFNINPKRQKVLLNALLESKAILQSKNLDQTTSLIEKNKKQARL